MKKVKTILALTSACAIMASAQPLGDYGQVNGDLRLFHMERTFDNIRDDAKAFTYGGVLGYVSPTILHTKLGVSYFGSHSAPNVYTDLQSSGTSLLQNDGSDISMLGEAYVETSYNGFTAKVGRQRLNTPLANDHDLRMLPTSYEAAIGRTSLGDVKLELGYIRAYSGFVSKLSEFQRTPSMFSEDGIGYIMASTTIANTAVIAQYAKPLRSVNVNDYRYVDTTSKFAHGITLAAQYGGNAYLDSAASVMLGAKLTKSYTYVDFSLLANQITGNAFKTIEAGPMFSDLQQGYGNYEPSLALGTQLLIKPVSSAFVKLSYVDVTSAEGYTVDDYAEFNVDTQYTFDKHNSIRARYSLKDQHAGSTREDRTDTRIIYYLKF